MTPTTLSIALLVALVGMAVVLNHCHARLALVELTFNEGLPPGHQRVETAANMVATATPVASTGASPGDTASGLLPVGIHVFLSRNCHACQRLIDEFEQVDVSFDAPLHLRYVDRPRPIAASAAKRQRASLHEHEEELAIMVGADPLPYTAAVGSHGLVSRAVTPTVPQVVAAARDAGIRVT